ncbi:MAG: Dehydrogenase-like protein [Candidatus Uhrbacteria bacterium GW2011_GWF2_39_13]|uniref:Dehydrogenase-like protein n=1 Tax=Candidatus Uhrbacteria bacterium GW2011_GWF2_39_13 TaxID=1618995 RepID=A0A0G0QNM3_9BACT|nr:MAG: Dehydrogenase-like protein [Candidatus Uhrbacteria bacterium GW2011_GWF2_39_13]
MRSFKRASDIKTGVIGYGGVFNMGKKHLEQMKKVGMNPTAVMEIDEERLKAAKLDFPETYNTLSAMLKNSSEKCF